jgi:hypothetical protein
MGARKSDLLHENPWQDEDLPQTPRKRKSVASLDSAIKPFSSRLPLPMY